MAPTLILIPSMISSARIKSLFTVTMEGQPTPAAGKSAKRPRPGLSASFDADDLDTPDLAEFQSTFNLTDDEMIRLCTAYASYLKATLRRKR